MGNHGNGWLACDSMCLHPGPWFMSHVCGKMLKFRAVGVRLGFWGSGTSLLHHSHPLFVVRGDGAGLLLSQGQVWSPQRGDTQEGGKTWKRPGDLSLFQHFLMFSDF